MTTYEAWMKERWRQSEIGRQREAQLIAEAEHEVQRRHMARMEKELALIEQWKKRSPIKRVK